MNKMQFGLKEDIITAIHNVFSQFKEIEKAVLYGSRAKGLYRPGSDIDLTLHGEGLNIRVLNRVNLMLDDLLLPYSFDISIYCHIDNAELIDHIARVGRLFYIRPPQDISISEQQELRPVTTDYDRLRTITDDYGQLDENEKQLLLFLLDNKTVTRRVAVELLNLQKTKVHKILTALIEKNLIIRKGEGRSTYYTLVKKEDKE